MNLNIASIFVIQRRVMHKMEKMFIGILSSSMTKIFLIVIMTTSVARILLTIINQKHHLQYLSMTQGLTISLS